jgi:hypothetical protein
MNPPKIFISATSGDLTSARQPDCQGGSADHQLSSGGADELLHCGPVIGGKRSYGMHPEFNQAVIDRVHALSATGQPLAAGMAWTRWQQLTTTWQRTMHCEAMRWGNLAAITYWKDNAVGGATGPENLPAWLPLAESILVQDLIALGFGPF